MTLFVIIAALLTGLAVIAVTVPLLKGGRGKWTALLIALLVPAGTILLYGHVSNWNWQPAPIAAATNSQDKRAQDIAAVVAMLERRLRAKPDDIDAWLMLGKSRLAVADVESAVQAFKQAHQLSGGKNPAVALSLGWALSLREGGRITSEANQLFETAIVLAPHDPRALLYGGLAAAQRGDVVRARQRWMELRGMHPTPKIAAMLEARLAELDRHDSPGTDQTSTSPAQVTVNLALAPRLAARVSSDTPLFIFAQLPNQQGPPLVVKRVTTAAIGSAVTLSAEDSMIPGRAISRGMQVMVTARIAFKGQAVAAKGDFYGQLAYTVGTDGMRELRIDKVL